jgi:ribosomal protein S18 acetylase RimI-like enzyme
MAAYSVSLRLGERDDAVTLAALSVQVFLDTYATEGVRGDLAREALREYSEAAFVSRLSEPGRKFVLAEAQAALVGFAELNCVLGEAPAPGLAGWELARLYVQPQAQGGGVGTALLRRAEQLAAEDGSRDLWLSVWERNERALAFYRRLGYADVGETTYAFEGREYGNRVVAKRLAAA